VSVVLQLVGVVVVPRLLLGLFVVRESEVLFAVVWCGLLHGPVVPSARFWLLNSMVTSVSLAAKDFVFLFRCERGSTVAKCLTLKLFRFTVRNRS